MKYTCNCNECGHEWTEESETEITYEDVTCEKCGTYENIFVSEIKE